MPELIQVQEHELIPYSQFSPHEKWREGMRLPAQAQGLDRWFFRWQWGNSIADDLDESFSTEQSTRAGYCASYVIGAQWLEQETTALVVTTKGGCDRVDFLKMFSTCLYSGIESSEFAKIYEIDLDKPRIKAPQLNSVLSPLIVVHFLSLVQKLIKHGLKRDYVQKEENLKKVRGHISISQNERVNVMRKSYERVYCSYQEYSEDILENRLIKKALLYSQRMISGLQHKGESYFAILYTLNKCLATFSNVSDQIEEWKVRSIKHHKLYKDYDDVIRIAKMILRRYDYSITNVSTAEEECCPVFWVDMSLLYEHYVLGLLRKAYGEKVEYQCRGYTGYPDFVSYNPKIIMDTKYIPRFEQGDMDVYIARQLSGYARDRRLFREQPNEMIPCLVIYPKEMEGEPLNPFKEKSLKQLIAQNEDFHLWGFYRVAVPLPTLDGAEKKTDADTASI